ncbi:MAG: glycosyltransferase [Solirubrobacteraceae bacterium]
MGLPVVGWRAGNLHFLADDGREGLLLAPGDVPGLASALLTLALDEGLRRRLGGAARARALQRPTWRETGQLFFDALRAALGRSHQLELGSASSRAAQACGDS